MGDPATTRTLIIRESVLDKNRSIAAGNRGRFDAWGCLALNMLSSPGAGKTALLERTLTDLSGGLRLAVIVGDLATDNDARRLGDRGASVVQITTGDICHLDAAMVHRACDELADRPPEVCFVENVGNMVCPAAFDLGEHARVALLSVTEGEDKPAKYPTLFRSADVVLITKSDLADATAFARDVALGALEAIAPHAPVIELSSRTGAGLDHWYAWIEERRTTRAA